MIEHPLFSGSVLTQPDGATKKTYRILVADDDEDSRHLMAHALIRAGYAVDAAENGVVAWDSLQVNSYDLLITDNGMPGLTGVELIAKSRDARVGLPVIMVTTAIPDQEFAKRPLLMPDAILRKPFVIDELLEKVKAILAEPLVCASESAGSDCGSSFYNCN